MFSRCGVAKLSTSDLIYSAETDERENAINSSINSEGDLYITVDNST